MPQGRGQPQGVRGCGRPNSSEGGAHGGASPRGGACQDPRSDRPSWRVSNRSGAMESGGPGNYSGAARRPLHSAQAVDVASASSFRAFEILHLHLDLRAEFGPPGPGPGSRGLSGTATLELRCLLPEGASELRLDSHSCLEVTAATLRRGQPGDQQAPAEPVPFHTQPFSHYGQALCVAFPQPCGAADRFELELTYRVGEGPGVSARGAPGPPASLSPLGQPAAPKQPRDGEQETWLCFRGRSPCPYSLPQKPALDSCPVLPIPGLEPLQPVLCSSYPSFLPAFLVSVGIICLRLPCLTSDTHVLDRLVR